jgi:LmbE family N-acetylglucosaminyl deacetylase
MSVCVFAFGCHPDDIEFLMSGTLFHLRERGAEIHYMNPANGSLGTTEYTAEEIIEIRRNEGEQAAKYLGAEYHDSLVNDLEVFYNHETIRKVTAKVREIKPDIMLVLSLEDYMEDHMNASKIGCAAVFNRGVRNYKTDPARDPIMKDVAIYHAMPYGLRDMMNRRIEPDFFIDIESVLEKKKTMLAIHKSQQKWLAESQGMDAYIQTMTEQSAEVGDMSRVFRFAEGWRKHNPLGYCAKESKPLEDVLGEHLHQNKMKGV